MALRKLACHGLERGVLFSLLCVFASGCLGAQSYLDTLIARSRELRLSERPEWHRLLHYAPNLLRPGVRSLADASAFFVAPDGKSNPESELEATLASFFIEIEETPERQHPQCAFVARYSWLDSVLQFDASRLAKQPCRRFRDWRDGLDPQAVTLVFPAAYINNPSSMYGHTLLRIDARDQDDSTRLLAYAINFAANTDETNGILFAVNSLIGVYPGRFSMMPYYLKVREYNDLENRDIWEYELNLTPQEIDRLLMHAWELAPVHFDYYFFDENCSYYLLELLEVARPGLRLTDPFRWWAIPSDTVREVVRQQGLLKRAVYRPSNATRVVSRLEREDSAGRAMVGDLARGRISARDAGFAALPGPDRARLLELGHDYLNYLRASGNNVAAEPASLARELLLERSRLGERPMEPAVPVPAVRPDQGHGTARVAPGIGRRDGVDFVEVRARPSYHELLDPEGGYAPGAQIEFVDFAVRDYRDARGTRVEHFTPVKIVSVSPRNDFFRPLSWETEVGWKRRRLADGREPLVFDLRGGAGLARSLPDELGGGMLLYGFLEPVLQVHGSLDKGYSFGAGPAGGLLADVDSRWRIEVHGAARRFFAGDTGNAWEAGLRQRYALSTNYALRLDIARESQAQQRWNVVTLSLHWYF